MNLAIIILLQFIFTTKVHAQNWLTAGNVLIGPEILGSTAGAFPLVIKTTPAQPINFWTTNINHCRIDATGNFTIGLANANNYFGITANEPVLWHNGINSNLYVGEGAGNATGTGINNTYVGILVGA